MIIQDFITISLICTPINSLNTLIYDTKNTVAFSTWCSDLKHSTNVCSGLWTVPLTLPDGTEVANTTFTIFNSAILAIINGAVCALALVSIFLYKNRNLQVRAINLALLLTCGLIGLLFFSADSMSTTLQAKVHYLYGTYIPVILAIFLFAAIRYIKRDEALVYSGL